MAKYLEFTVNNEKVGIKYSSNYKIEETHINKVFIKNNEEYIKYKGNKILVLDTGMILHQKPLKKFDGLVFISTSTRTIALKVEGFFKDVAYVEKEINPLKF